MGTSAVYTAKMPGLGMKSHTSLVLTVVFPHFL